MQIREDGVHASDCTPDFFLKRPRLRAIGQGEHMWHLEQGKCMSDSRPLHMLAQRT